MKRTKRFFPLLFATLLLGLTSCNRGYGCPGTNFSVEDIGGILIALF